MDSIQALNESINQSLSNGVFSHVIEGRPRQFAGMNDALAVLRGEMTVEEAEERLVEFKGTPAYIDCDSFTITPNPDGTFNCTAEIAIKDSDESLLTGVHIVL